MNDTTLLADIERLAHWSLRTLRPSHTELTTLLRGWCDASNVRCSPALLALVAAHARAVHHAQVPS